MLLCCLLLPLVDSLLIQTMPTIIRNDKHKVISRYQQSNGDIKFLCHGPELLTLLISSRSPKCLTRIHM